MKEKLKDSIINITEFIQSLIFIGSLINAVMAPVIGKLEKVNLPKCVEQYAEFFNTTSMVYAINWIILLFFAIKLFVVIMSNNIKRNTALIGLMDALHINYIHDMRNSIYRLEEITLSKNIAENTNYEVLYNAEYKLLEHVAQKCVNQVSEVLNDCMGLPRTGKTSICTCIKMVSIYEKEKPISERSVITLARSANSSSARTTEKHIIGKNSDFLDLSKGYRNFYSGINLKKQFEQGEYQNSTKDFAYESTIVVPIRCADIQSAVSVAPTEGRNKEVEIKIQSNIDIVGYLCIDTEKVLREWGKIENVEKVVQVLAFYADSLYIYLSAFRKAFTVERRSKK